jgi:hypothetical protein
MGGRGNIFLMGLDVDAQCVMSIAVDITRKVTEFLFKEKGNRNSSNDGAHQTVNNSLLDCHAEVWTRFPIVPAVGRQTITSSSERRRKSLTFITEDHAQPFSSYFSDLIHRFERATRKPAGNELRRIEVSAAELLFKSNVIQESDWNVSRYRVGEWLVDLLCLIPIHIAVCRENRFVPLADGVLSAELERSLLGAEVNKIVDKLSFGWYESIFKSYMALKVSTRRPFILLDKCNSFFIAGEGRIINGPAVCGKEFRVEPPCRYIICRECHANNWYFFSTFNPGPH